MAEESTTPDLVELWRQTAEALGRSDFDAGLSCFAPDAVWEVQPLARSFEAVPAIRSFVEDWIGNYDEYRQELVEGQDLGNDVVFALNRRMLAWLGRRAGCRSCGLSPSRGERA